MADTRYTRWLTLILLIGALLRVIYALDQPTMPVYRSDGGGDSGWFLANGAGFFSGREHGYIHSTPFYMSEIPIPPFYILYVGLVQQFLPQHESVIAIRLLQCLASVATVYLVCRIATLISDDRRAGLAAAALAVFHPAMIMEPANIATETFYMFFLAIGFWLYLEYFLLAEQSQPSIRLSPTLALALAALAFGLATLTRAVSVLFPIVIVIHLARLGRRHLISNWTGKSLLLLVVYAALVSSWTLHNALLWNRFIIVSDQLLPAVWRAFETEDGSPQENDVLLLEGFEDTLPKDCEVDCKFQHSAEAYIQKIQANVSADPAGFLALRVNELAYSILQPHGTTSLGEVSIMEAAGNWLTASRSLNGLLGITQIEGFASKLAVWLFHYTGIVFGLIGMIWSRRRWQMTLPLIGFVAYTIAAHFFLLAEPRYLFPSEMVMLIFAGIAVVKSLDRWNKRSTAGSASA